MANWLAMRRSEFSYEREIAGLQALDRYTLRIRLKAPDPNFLFYLATPAGGGGARSGAGLCAQAAIIRSARGRS
jgi:ABC-type transport system substrate-binding protein